ncbi:MAG: hypothetical protein IJ497_06600 [Clostridia bacterium]|nr:hypothetical protein [Clostridia bacterium]
MKRLLALILCAMMLAPTFASCSEKSQDGGETTPSTTADASTPSGDETGVAEEELTDYEKRQLIPDDLPDTTFNGEEFRVLTNADGYSGRVIKTIEIAVDELTGDVCNDAVYNRNLRIEDRFDVKITCGTDTDPQSYVNTFVTAGTDDYHVVGFYNYLAATPIAGKSLLDWNDAPYVNLEKPWHNKLANDQATVYGTLYAACSDLSLSSMTYTYAYFANINLLEEYTYSTQDMYDLVKSGEWTVDKFIEITTPMYQDKDGDGKAGVNDVFGFGYQPTNPPDVWLSAFNQPIVEINEQGAVEMAFMTEKTVAIVEKLVSWHENTEGFYRYGTQYDEEKYFNSGNLVFAPLRFYTAYNVLREMEDAYTILPWPKWDEQQDKYYTSADDKFTVFGLPLTSYGMLDFVSIMYEVMSAETYKTVYPEYYDTALKGKYSAEKETAEMVDLIMEGRDFDFSFQFSGSVFKDIPYFVRRKIESYTTNIASDYKKVEKSVNKSIEKQINELYMDMSGD